MSAEVGQPPLNDPAARGYDGRQLLSVDPPAQGQAPSPAWLAQLGRSPIGRGDDDRKVMRRLAEDGLAVPGDDPLYQYLGAQRVIAAEAEALHDQQLARMRAMMEEARNGLAQLLGEVAAAGAAAVAARRGEDEAALNRFTAEMGERIAAGTRLMRDAMAEERAATVAAVTVAVVEALATVSAEQSPTDGRGRHLQLPRRLGSGWALGGQPAALWAAVLGGSVFAGLVLVWMLKH